MVLEVGRRGGWTKLQRGSATLEARRTERGGGEDWESGSSKQKRRAVAVYNNGAGGRAVRWTSG